MSFVRIKIISIFYLEVPLKTLFKPIIRSFSKGFSSQQLHEYDMTNHMIIIR